MRSLNKLVGMLALGLVMSGFAGEDANATLKIDITQGHSEPLPIALTDFTAQSSDLSEVGRNIIGVVTSDLERSGLFKALDKASYIEKITNGNAVPRFPDWRQIGAQGLVTGTIQPQGSGKLVVSFRLWDVISEQQVAGKEYTTLESNWRRIAHIISDEIYKRLTGEEGYFDTRIVYIAESGPAKNRTKRLAIMDQDGANHKFLTDGRNLVLTPRFSPNSQEIIYLSYAGNKPRVYIRNLQTGREGLLGEYPGMSFSPRFSPKGDKIAFSVAQDGNTDIYVMDLRSRRTSKLTNDAAIDTSPSFSPDSSKIVFNSDRGGSQQLYTMNIDGSNVQRISFGSGKYGTPEWSPRGDWIAYTKISGGQFYIGVMRPDGSGERSLANAYLAESPSWSPNGRVIIYNKEERGGGSRIFSVDLTGYNEREVVTPIEASDPSWSALLPM